MPIKEAAGCNMFEKYFSKKGICYTSCFFNCYSDYWIGLMFSCKIYEM